MENQNNQGFNIIMNPDMKMEENSLSVSSINLSQQTSNNFSYQAMGSSGSLNLNTSNNISNNP
jgi:hypothetical protein